MPINNLYHTWFQRIQGLRPNQRVTQIRNFTWLIVGIHQSRSVNLSKIAGKIPGAAKLAAGLYGINTMRGSNLYRATYVRVNPNHIVTQQDVGDQLYDELTSKGFDVEIRYNTKAYDSVTGAPVKNGVTQNWVKADVQAFDFYSKHSPLSPPYEIEPGMNPNWSYKDKIYGPTSYTRVTY